jgi:GNAT superfamily N-acetyltransferase
MTLIYREGTIEDNYAAYQVFTQSILDLGDRTNVMTITGGSNPEVMNSLWQSRGPLFEFLARDCAHFWIAESDGKIIGYARSIGHDGLLELTEFFVLPNQQSAGVGGELLARAFPKSNERYHTIVATLDERALYRYLSAGVYGRFPIKYFSRKAEKVDIKSDLQFEPMQLEIHLDDINRIDEQVVGHQREAIHRWIITTRLGYVYKRNGEVVGYGYVGRNSGPFAVLDANDFPAALAHAESRVAEMGDEFGVETPLINKSALGYFLERKYKMDAFTALFMSNEPFGRFENYLCFSPILFM